MENRLLSCLPVPELAVLASHFKQIQLTQGSVLHEPEASIETVYFPLSGAISLLAVMNGGEASEIASVGREGAVGVLAHSGVWRARSWAIVHVPGFAEAISSEVLRTAIEQNAVIRELMLRYKTELAAQTEQLAACNAVHSVEERLARWLLQMSDRIDSDELPATQETLSHILGVRRTTVTNIAQKLQKDGLIRYRRGHILIVDRSGLDDLACECYSAYRQVDALIPLSDDDERPRGAVPLFAGADSD